MSHYHDKYFTAQITKSAAKLAYQYGRLLDYAKLPRTDADGNPLTVLDAGCGAGPALRYLSGQGYHAYGCDFIFYPLIESRKLVPTAPVVCCDLKQPLPYRDASFDAVLLSEVVEHLHEAEDLLRECARILRPGGYVLITTPNLWDVRRPLAWLTRRTWSGYVDPTHINLFTPPRLRRTMQAAGFGGIRLRTGLKPIFLFAPRRLPLKLSLPYPPLIGNGLVAVGRTPGGAR